MPALTLIFDLRAFEDFGNAFTKPLYTP